MKIREKVLKRDGRKCTLCGAPGEIVVKMPSFRMKIAKGKRPAMKDLKTVCTACLHKMCEPRGNNMKKMIAQTGEPIELG
jgi:5-methylcytosine-specific restriction endonuclease McrA